MSGEVVHFEIPMDDAERGQAFYRDVFGWNIDAMPEFEYAMALTSPVDENGRPAQPGAINGGMMQRRDPLTTPIVTVSVDDIDATLETVASHGGSTVLEKSPVGDMGYAAYFRDSEGNIMGLWQNAT